MKVVFARKYSYDLFTLVGLKTKHTAAPGLADFALLNAFKQSARHTFSWRDDFIILVSLPQEERFQTLVANVVDQLAVLRQVHHLPRPSLRRQRGKPLRGRGRQGSGKGEVLDLWQLTWKLGQANHRVWGG